MCICTMYEEYIAIMHNLHTCTCIMAQLFQNICYPCMQTANMAFMEVVYKLANIVETCAMPGPENDNDLQCDNICTSITGFYLGCTFCGGRCSCPKV